MKIVKNVEFKLKSGIDKVSAKRQLCKILSDDLLDEKQRRLDIVKKGFKGVDNMDDNELANFLNYCGLESYVEVKNWR